MKKTQPVTMKAISKLLDEKLKLNNEILLLSFDRDIKLLEGNLTEFRNEVNGRFDIIEDRIQSLDERLIVQSTRIKQVEKERFVAP